MDTQKVYTDLWLAVHIPKSGGTSFRISLEKYFGKSRVIRDYGPKARETSKIVRKFIYAYDGPNGADKMLEAIGESTAKVLIGHFPLNKYARFFDPGRVITFVRDPLIRTCSEYVHRVGNRTFEGTLQEFFRKPDFRNQQSFMLEGMSDRAFVGLTENYADSLKRINAFNHWNLAVRKRNVGRKGGGQKLAESLSEQDLELFYKMNGKELDFYQDMRQRFEGWETPEADA